MSLRIATPPEIGIGRVTPPGSSSRTWERIAGGSCAAGIGSSSPPCAAVLAAAVLARRGGEVRAARQLRRQPVGERQRLGLAALGEGQGDLAELDDLDRRGLGQAQRRVEIGLGRHGAFWRNRVWTTSRHIRPASTKSSIVCRSMPRAVEHAEHVVDGQAALAGELLDAGVDRALGQLDAELRRRPGS